MLLAELAEELRSPTEPLPAEALPVERVEGVPVRHQPVPGLGLPGDDRDPRRMGLGGALGGQGRRAEPGSDGEELRSRRGLSSGRGRQRRYW